MSSSSKAEPQGAVNFTGYKSYVLYLCLVGREFITHAVELRNNSAVNLKMIQKLSTRQSSLESRVKVSKEIASENGIILKMEEAAAIAADGYNDCPPISGNIFNAMVGCIQHCQVKLAICLEMIQELCTRRGRKMRATKMRKSYKDVADAAEASFRLAAYAAAAARAAVEPSRSGPPMTDDCGNNTQITEVKSRQAEASDDDKTNDEARGGRGTELCYLSHKQMLPRLKAWVKPSGLADAMTRSTGLADLKLV
ncbi:hypothetical protein Nepgr_017052 [Nepenthes gracilis]|uniref:Uncharacterized protein n=1 Tax=Nepenthes gracilis TaxID=150966 RepID=A0AAD3XSY1_NEPGR|nr:hypothetical protein Nepgr_017052 [Nepenthes gracilis]